MVIWAISRKDLRLLLRDARAMIILLAMPLIFIIVLGVSLGEDWGKRDKLKVSVVNLDQGLPAFVDRQAKSRNEPRFPPESWSAQLLHDLEQTADIEVETLTREEAERLIKSGRRPAVLILGPHFSKRVERCSFLAAGWQETFAFAASYPQAGHPVELALAGFFQEGQNEMPLYLVDGINPFHRDGVREKALDIELLRDPTQIMSAAIVEQVVQGSLLRVVLPWMIGRAFAKISEPDFLAMLSGEEKLPWLMRRAVSVMSDKDKRELGMGLQNSLQRLFPRYHLTAKTWAGLTKESEHTGKGRETRFKEDGEGWLKRGAARYQMLVPSFLVMFAFFLVLTVGWLFVSERRQGTLLRLRAAPLSRWQILLGKLLPCYLVSLFQGFFLLGAGKLIFSMNLGPDPLWLIPLVFSTSLAAMGLALLVAAVARTETQVAVYGTLLVLVLAGLSGSLMGDVSQIPEALQDIRLFTPHAWALDGYKQLLASEAVDVAVVARSCGVLALFGVGFVVVAWWLLRLD